MQTVELTLDQRAWSALSIGIAVTLFDSSWPSEYNAGLDEVSDFLESTEPGKPSYTFTVSELAYDALSYIADSATKANAPDAERLHAYLGLAAIEGTVKYENSTDDTSMVSGVTVADARRFFEEVLAS
jgi:hypothetical protein